MSRTAEGLDPASVGAEHPDLARVSQKLEAAIIEFATERLRKNFAFFFMRELEAFIKRKGIQCAPDSGSRILRKLNHHRIEYVLVSRSASQYRIKSVVGYEGGN